MAQNKYDDAVASGSSALIGDRTSDSFSLSIGTFFFLIIINTNLLLLIFHHHLFICLLFLLGNIAPGKVVTTEFVYVIELEASLKGDFLSFSLPPFKYSPQNGNVVFDNFTVLSLFYYY